MSDQARADWVLKHTKRGNAAVDAPADEDEKKRKQDEEDWAAYIKETKDPTLSGLGGAAARTRKKDEFEAWRKKRAGSATAAQAAQALAKRSEKP